MLCFVIPNPESFPSGGNIYNANLIKGLQSNGVKVTTVFDVDPDLLKRENIFFFIDTLYVEKIKKQNWPTNSYLIVHHLPSMELLYEEKKQAEEQEKKYLKKFKGFLSTSDFTSSYLRNTFSLTQPILTIPPAISEKAIEQNTRSNSTQKVLLVANLIERKGILSFLKEWSKYSWPNSFSLEIIGAPTLEPDYAKACHDFYTALPFSKKEKINFLGPKSQEEVFLKYQQSNLLISTSKMETFGMAIQEAIAFGLPVLVLKGGYSSNHLSEKNKGRSFDRLKNLVAALKEWSDDPGIRTAMQSDSTAPNTYSWKEAAGEFIRQLKNHSPDV